MPIISRQLDFARQQADGRFKCRVSGVDSAGRNWVHGTFWANSLAEAQVIRDSVAWDIEGAEETDAVTFVEDGGDPNAFPNVDLSTVELRRRLAKRFANADIDTNRRFLCKISPWIASFTATQIANALSIPTAKAQRILDRAIKYRDVLCPAIDTDAPEDV